MEIRLKDVEAIYHSALEETSPAKRSAFLDVACKNNPTLRAQVEMLLKADEAAGDFLEVPVLEPDLTLDNTPLTEGTSTVIGRYKLLEKIGEGGNHPYSMTMRHEILDAKDRIPAGFELTCVGVIAEAVPISGAISASLMKAAVGTFSILLDELMV